MQRRRLGFKSKPIIFNRKFENQGYIYLRRNGEYVKRSRIVMEEYIGRKLSCDEIVHHINGDKSDDRIENLYLCNGGSEHNRVHHQAFRLVGELVEKGIIDFDKTSGTYVFNSDS
ncbi:hypothetical protein COL77_26025 [Bacillus wiedmannii]|nr:hypothetical protein COL77_26025 [Bacillus wiedmannii]PGA34192.1 hypothetical protein COL74_12175 [Bacillus wiedmannii]